MESIDPVWLFGGIALIAGVLLGVLAHRSLSPRAGEAEKLKAELLQSREEMVAFKASVNSHFSKTSDLVNELTQDYVKVYRHLAEGAQALSDTREFTQVLDQPRGQVLISVENEVAEPAPLAGLGATEGSPQATQVATPPAETPPEATAAADELPAAEVSPPADYARGGEGDGVATEAVAEASTGPEDIDKAVEQDVDKEKNPENAEPVVTAKAADSSSTPAPDAVKQTLADEDPARSDGKARSSAG